MILKLFKIGYNRDPKKAQKTKLGPKMLLPNMRIANHVKKKAL